MPIPFIDRLLTGESSSHYPGGRPGSDIKDQVTGFVDDAKEVFVDIFGVFLDKDKPSAGKSEQTTNRSGLVNDIPVCYGTNEVGGLQVFPNGIGGNSNEHIYSIDVLSEGPCEGIVTKQINDIISTDPRFRGRHEEAFDEGSAAATFPPKALALEANGWTPEHTLVRLCNDVDRFTWKDSPNDKNPYNKGTAPKKKRVLKGLKIADATLAGNNIYETETRRFSANPSDIILDYMRSEYYGAGIANYRINFLSFARFARRCNERILYNNGKMGPRRTLNIVVDTGETLFENMRTLLWNARAQIDYREGQFHIIPIDSGGAASSQSEPTVDMNIGPDQIVMGTFQIEDPDPDKIFNQLQLKFVDAENRFQDNEVTVPEVGSPNDMAYLAADGGIRNSRRVTFKGVNNKYIAADIAKELLEESRDRHMISFVGTGQCANLVVHSLINVTHSKMGITNQKYRIKKIVRNNQDKTYAIIAQQHDPENFIFNDTSAQYAINVPIKYQGENIQSVDYEWDEMTNDFEPYRPLPADENDLVLPSVSTNNTSSGDIKLIENRYTRIGTGASNVVATHKFEGDYVVPANFTVIRNRIHENDVLVTGQVFIANHLLNGNAKLIIETYNQYDFWVNSVPFHRNQASSGRDQGFDVRGFGDVVKPLDTFEYILTDDFVRENMEHRSKANYMRDGERNLIYNLNNDPASTSLLSSFSDGTLINLPTPVSVPHVLHYQTHELEALNAFSGTNGLILMRFRLIDSSGNESVTLVNDFYDTNNTGPTNLTGCLNLNVDSHYSYSWRDLDLSTNSRDYNDWFEFTGNGNPRYTPETRYPNLTYYSPIIHTGGTFSKYVEVSATTNNWYKKITIQSTNSIPMKAGSTRQPLSHNDPRITWTDHFYGTRQYRPLSLATDQITDRWIRFKIEVSSQKQANGVNISTSGRSVADDRKTPILNQLKFRSINLANLPANNRPYIIIHDSGDIIITE